MFSKMFRPLTIFSLIAVFCFAGHVLTGGNAKAEYDSLCMGELTFDESSCSDYSESECSSKSATRSIKTEPGCESGHIGYTCEEFESETTAGTVDCTWTSGSCTNSGAFPRAKYTNC